MGPIKMLPYGEPFVAISLIPPAEATIQFRE